MACLLWCWWWFVVCFLVVFVCVLGVSGFCGGAVALVVCYVLVGDCVLVVDLCGLGLRLRCVLVCLVWLFGVWCLIVWCWVVWRWDLRRWLVS